MEVNIYIVTTIHGPRIRNGAYGWVLEYIKKNGEPITREGVGGEENTTENRLVLMALTEAVNRLIVPCSVRVFTQCEHVINSYSNFWVFQWEKNDWHNAKGKPVKNADLWQSLLDAAVKHAVTFAEGENTYKVWAEKEAKAWEAMQDWGR